MVPFGDRDLVDEELRAARLDLEKLRPPKEADRSAVAIREPHMVRALSKIPCRRKRVERSIEERGGAEELTRLPGLEVSHPLPRATPTA